MAADEEPRRTRPPALAEDEPATQWLRSTEDFLDARGHDIGRPVGPVTRELFVSCDAAQALQLQFEHTPFPYVALHEIACSAARPLLQSISLATGQAVQQLVIRRQGYGTTLASLAYLDCPAGEGERLRLYATQADQADSGQRQALAQVLNCHATLVMVLVGELPVHRLSEQFQPLREAMASPHWQCPWLHLVPLTPSLAPGLGLLAQALSAGSGVPMSLGQLTHRPSEAWAQLREAWNHVAASRSSGPAALPLLPLPAPQRDPLEPMPATARERSAGTREPLERLADHMLAQPGVLATCVFDLASSKVLAHAGMAYDATDLARRGTLLLTAGSTSRRQLGLAGGAEELLVKGGDQALGLRCLQGIPGLAVHVVYRPAQSSWVQLRPRLMALDAALPRSPVI